MTDSPALNACEPPILLTVTGLTMRFGGLTAVDSVSFQAKAGEITAVIGPNGAGKTTLFNCLTGFYRPTAGQLLLQGDKGPVNLAGLPAHRIARLGLARTFQNIRLFSGMTVLENLLVAEHHALMAASFFSIAGLLNLPGYRRAKGEALDKAGYWMDLLGLTAHTDKRAGDLPYGQQRRLEIARAMCTSPRLLCLDEPAAGLNPAESVALRQTLQKIRAETGIGLLLIEHNMNVVMEISDHIVVMDYGKAIADGTPHDIRNNPTVIRAYLGEPEEGAA